VAAERSTRTPSTAPRRRATAADTVEADTRGPAEPLPVRRAGGGREAEPAAAPRTLRVTWRRSAIGHRPGARGTIRALGLHRLNQTVSLPDTPAIRGMLRRVAFLVSVDEDAEGETT
jgi:large subunit ribosomal protein L30